MNSKKIAVIVTVKNDAEALLQLRQDLDQQTVTPDEIVLAVANSRDASLRVAQQWASESKQLIVLDVGQANRSQGRNLAIKASKSELIAFTDAGCRPDTNWLEALISPFSQSGVQLVSGLTLGAPENDWEAAQVPYTLVLPHEVSENPLPATRNMVVTRSAFKKVGNFREDLAWGAEDYEWSRRAQAMSVRAVLAREAIVYWRPRPSRFEFWKMLHSLTLGDVQAETWRWGHASMLGRYGFFGGLAVVSLPFSSLLWAGYVALKSRHTSRKAKTKWFETAQAQILADAAVVSGVIRGVWLKSRQKKSE